MCGFFVDFVWWYYQFGVGGCSCLYLKLDVCGVFEVIEQYEGFVRCLVDGEDVVVVYQYYFVWVEVVYEVCLFVEIDGDVFIVVEGLVIVEVYCELVEW